MKYLNKILSLMFILIINGCYISEDIKTKNEFIKKSQSGEVSILTKDTTKYLLYHSTLQDSIIRGSGKIEKNNVAKDFNGEIYLSDVVYIQSQDISYWGTIAAVGVVGFLGMSTIAILDDNKEGVNVKIVYPYGGGGSCPFIYSKNNSKYILEGEAIPLSLGKKLETETTNLLAHLYPGNKEIELRINNERPETHYINSIRLLKYIGEPGTKLLADENNKVWPVINSESPLIAEDINKQNIIFNVKEDDEIYWESDLSAASPSGGYRDHLYITFRKEEFKDSASLIIKAVNTRISDVLFRKIYDFLGDEVLDFVYAAENDPEIISLLKSWIEEVSLKVFVWNGKSWNYGGKIYPEATKQPFERLTRLDIKNIISDNLKIKLEFMTDVWKIDAVSIDYSNIESLTPVKIPLISAEVFNKNIKEKIENRDENYQVLLPGDKIDLKFYDNEAAQNSIYFLNVSGYLYEWYVKELNSNSDLLSFIPDGISRLQLFKSILSNKNLMLPPVYNEWEKVKNKMSSR